MSFSDICDAILLNNKAELERAFCAFARVGRAKSVVGGTDEQKKIAFEAICKALENDPNSLPEEFIRINEEDEPQAVSFADYILWIRYSPETFDPFFSKGR